jgi:hypothetical protein
MLRRSADIRSFNDTTRSVLFHAALHVHLLADAQDRFDDHRGGARLRFLTDVGSNHELCELVTKRRNLKPGDQLILADLDPADLAVVLGDFDFRMSLQRLEGFVVHGIGSGFE